MCTQKYLKNKKHILKWRVNNIDKYREINRINKRRYDSYFRMAKVCRLILI